MLVNLSLGGAGLGSATIPPDFFLSGEYFTPGTTPTWQPAILIEAGQTSGSLTLNGLGELSTLVVVNAEPPAASPTTPAVEEGVELTQQQVTAKLSQDALPAIVTLNVSTNQISESPIGTVTVTANLPAGQVATSNIVVNLTLGGTAIQGTDYIASGTEIVIPKGQSSGSITLTATGNPIALNETIIVTMTGLNGAYNQSPQQVLVTLTPGGTASGTISGTVKDSSGNPLSGVIVYLDPLLPANLVSTSNVASLSGVGQTIDGVTTTAGMIVLLTAQTNPIQNGAWTVNAGAWTRPADFSTGSHASEVQWYISSGTAFGGTVWTDTNAAGSDVVDTASLTIAEGSAGGSPFNPASNIFTTTNATGAYSISGLMSGDAYIVSELTPTAYFGGTYVVTSPAGDAEAVTVSSSTPQTVNFTDTLVPPASTVSWGAYQRDRT